MPAAAPPSRAEVVVVGCGPAGAATATWLARAGRDVVVVDAARFPRDKTCGDGLTPRAMSELERLCAPSAGGPGGVGDLVGASRIDGLELAGFGHRRRVPWPDSAFGRRGAAVPRRVFDDRLRALAASSGARIVEGCRVTGVRRGAAGRVTAVEISPDDPSRTTHSGARGQTIDCDLVVDAGGVRSPLGRALGRTWHRDTVHAVAARSYVASGKHDHPWIGSHLELRDESGTIQPGYGWVFPLSDGDVNLGVGALATARRPAAGAVKKILEHYARQVAEDWRLTGPPREVASALLPMGGAVSGIAGPNWAMVGDAAACVNPLNGEGIDYALEGGRLLAELVATEPGSDLTAAWPAVLREHYGRSFAIARDLAWLLTWPRFLPAAGPVGMRSQRLMHAAVRCMSNVVSDADADLVSRAWHAAGSVARRVDSRPLFGPAQ